jgi:hypothetical protein
MKNNTVTFADDTTVLVERKDDTIETIICVKTAVTGQVSI